MAETTKACRYWVVRYTPNVARDEWLNVGVLLLEPGRPRFRARFIEEGGEFGRVKRAFPNLDEPILRALEGHFEASVGEAEDPAGYLAKMEETLSNVIQLSPARGLLTEDFEAELDRLYQQHVAPPRARLGAMGRIYEMGRGYVRARLNALFRSAGLSEMMERHVPVAEFTYPGDPLRVDFAYRRNGTRGFVQSFSLDREAGQVKVLAYTAERMRQRTTATEFTVVTDTVAQAGNERHQFVRRLLGEQEIGMVAVGELEPWVGRLRAQLLQ